MRAPVAAHRHEAGDDRDGKHSRDDAGDPLTAALFDAAAMSVREGGCTQARWRRMMRRLALEMVANVFADRHRRSSSISSSSGRSRCTAR
jgi:hypothetical protein